MANGKLTRGKIIEIENKYGIKVSEQWLNQLLSMGEHERGVVKASGKLIQGIPLDDIVKNYQILDNELGIVLPLVIGGGPQYDELPAYKGSFKVNGIRVTPSGLLEQMLPVAQENLDHVVAALTSAGVKAVAMPNCIFKVEPHGVETYFDEEKKEFVEQDTGFVGDVVRIDTAPVIAALHEGKVPVLSHIGIDVHAGLPSFKPLYHEPNPQYYNINATTAAAALVKQLQAYKLILLGDKPILDANGELIKEIKSEAQLHKLLKEGTIKDGMAINAQEAYDLLKIMGPGRSVQITTPEDLIKELLSDGAGTMFRMPFIVQSYHKPEHVGKDGKELLTDKIDQAFADRGMALVPGYWDSHEINEKAPIDRMYIDAPVITGGAVVRKLWDHAYMCKLFKEKGYRGSGLAKQLMDDIISDQGCLFWRTGAEEGNVGNIEHYKAYVDNFKNSSLQKPGKVSTYEKVGESYWVFAVNVYQYYWNLLKLQVSCLPQTLVKHK